MEHLIFEADESHETVSACREEVLRADWQNYQELIDFVPPKTPWLGFDHDALPVNKLPDYPKMAGFDTENLWNAEFRECHSDLKELSGLEISTQVVALFQAWLYYGVLESVLRKKIQISYFMRHDADGEKCLYSRNLHFCLQAKVFEIRANPRGKSRVNQDIQLDLRLTNNWISRFTAWSHPSFRAKLDNDYPGCMDRLEEIVPAIVRLAEAVERTRLYALLDYPTMGTLTWHYPYRVADGRRLKLRGLGWCPFQIKMLEHTVNHSTIDWIAARSIEQDPAGHQTCTAKDCARNNVDASTYQQTHVCSGGQRQKIFPDLHRVIQILKEDGIPVMQLELIEGNLQVSVSASSKANPGDFITISHVWVDGLGGAAELGLNMCQVEWLSKICESIYKCSGNARFWVDSLCIPRVDKEVYYKALNGIRDVYINAASVLVVDKFIGCCTTSSSTEDLYAHIYLSAWMQRMWTYEEAVLAKELIFVLKDGFHTYRVDTGPSMRRTVSVVWQSIATQLYRLRADQDRLNIGQIYQAFRYRLTNVPQEEFLSVSGMVNLDTDSLLRVKGEERAKKFWLMLKSIPFNVPFSDCPKLSEPGFRWAPKTMMHPSQTALDADVKGERSECTEHGLIGTYLTVSFDNALHGCAGRSGSLFYTWIKGSDDSVNPPGDHRALLRLYCVESWPEPPSSLDFDTVMLPSETRSVMNKGAWVAGAAFSQQDEAIPRHLALQNAAGKYRYVGRLLIERLQDREMSSSTGTIMFEGSARTRIDAEGVWSVKRVCIT